MSPKNVKTSPAAPKTSKGIEKVSLYTALSILMGLSLSEPLAASTLVLDDWSTRVSGVPDVMEVNPNMPMDGFVSNVVSGYVRTATLTHTAGSVTPIANAITDFSISDEQHASENGIRSPGFAMNSALIGQADLSLLYDLGVTGLDLSSYTHFRFEYDDAQGQTPPSYFLRLTSSSPGGVVSSFTMSAQLAPLPVGTGFLDVDIPLSSFANQGQVDLERIEQVEFGIVGGISSDVRVSGPLEFVTIPEPSCSTLALLAVILPILSRRRSS